VQQELGITSAFPGLPGSFDQESGRLRSHQGSPEEFGRKSPVPEGDTEGQAVSGCSSSGWKEQPERAGSCDLLGRSGVAGCRAYHKPAAGQRGSGASGLRCPFSRCLALVIPRSVSDS